MVAHDPSSHSVNIEFSPEFLANDDARKDLQQSLEAGIEFAWRQSRLADPTVEGLLVRNVRLHYMVVDSTPKCVAYAAAGALLHALGLGQLLPQFQPEKSWEEMVRKSADTM